MVQPIQSTGNSSNIILKTEVRKTVANPGLPRGRQLSTGCANLLFYQKLDKKERLWTERKAHVPGAPLDPLLEDVTFEELWILEQLQLRRCRPER